MGSRLWLGLVPDIEKLKDLLRKGHRSNMDIFYPVQVLADWLSYSLFRLAKVSVLGRAVNFFIFDSIKIFLLLAVIIFVVSVIRSYLPPEKTKKWLSNRFEIVGNIIAALIGIVTPFCSCSAVPLFIGLVESGVPLGVTFSYLISAPMVNEVAAVMLLGLFWAGSSTHLYIFRSHYCGCRRIHSRTS